LGRAFYREAMSLVLDEGAANIDPDTEESIAELVAGLPITRIVEAHRAALLARVGRVLLLRDGRLEEVTVEKRPAEV
jgi:ATP-binding cassette subfamily B protein RaxB